MALQQWRKPKPLSDPNAIQQLEKKYGVKLSKALADCIRANNGGRPKPNAVPFKNGGESDMKMLLSYNEEDLENIYRVIGFFVQNYKGRLVPFATDSGGNYYCEMGKQIVYWTQGGEIYPVCDSFEELLASLYAI